jgi:hypothetical protein
MSLSGRPSSPDDVDEDADARFPPKPLSTPPLLLVVVVPWPLAPGAIGAISIPVNEMVV